MHQASQPIISTNRLNQTTSAGKPNPALVRLHAGVTELLDSAAWQEALKFKAKFHRYSFNNSVLIFLQCPDATLVAGYKRWQELGRQVRKSETSIAILAPIVRKVRDEETGEEVQRVVGFRSARVFDVSQTDGDPVPKLSRPVLLEHDSDAIREVLARAKTFAAAKGFPISYHDLRGDALGSFSVTKQTIKLRSDLPPYKPSKRSFTNLPTA